jgi:hypothetical protein
MDNTGNKFKNIIVDFDETLIFENSSRVFEKVLFDQSNGITRFLLRSLFFGKVSPLTNRVLGIFSLLFLGGRDMRLLFFLIVFKETIRRNSDFLIEQTITFLNINPELNTELQKGDIIILSRGICEIITSFLERNNFLFTKVIGSKLSKHQATGLLTLRDKLFFLRDIKEFCYYTDDENEKNFLIRNIRIEKVEETFFSSKKIFVVYHEESQPIYRSNELN